MTFYKRSRRPGGAISGAIGDLCARAVMGTARAAMSLAMLAVLASVILFIRLSDGPVHLPGLSRYLVDRANATSETIRVEVGTAVLNLGDGSGASGLEFRDVRVASPEGHPLFAVPRLRASFDFFDLVRGYVRPTRISIVSADAQFIRNPDGRIRFGLGGGQGVALAEDGAAATTSEGQDAVSKLIDGLSGDNDLAPEMSKLRVIEVLNARIVFSDRMAGGRMITRKATLRLRRDAGGATALLDIAGVRGAAPGEIVRLVADRRKGAGFTSVAGRFGQVDLKKLAAFLPILEGLENVDALAEGEVAARFDRDGWPLSLRGKVVVDRGSMRIGDADYKFDVAALNVDADMKHGVVRITDALVSAPVGTGRADGVLSLKRDDIGHVIAVKAQINVAALDIVEGAVFAEPVSFDRGQVVLAWTPNGESLEIADSWLGRDDLTIRLSGRLARNEGEWGADLRAETERLDVRDLVRHWPLEAAANARTWIAENVSKGTLRNMIAQVRIRPDGEVLALNARFTDLVSTYIDGMSPVRDGSGEMFVEFDKMHLTMRAGEVRSGREVISLAGSSMVITDFHAPVTPADIRLRARGETETVLNLIDQEPLGLVRALGLDLGRVAGQTRVQARMRFPLIAALRVADVKVDAEADLSDVRLGLALDGQRRIDVRSDNLNVVADTERMRLKGSARLDGSPVRVDWREDYAQRPGRREVRLAGAITPDLLRQIGLDGEMITGRADAKLDLSQRGKDPMRFELDANLKKTGLRIDAIDWTKTPGSDGRLRAKGTLGPRTVVERLELEAPALRVSGDVVFRESGRLDQALLRRVVLPGRLDASVSIQTGSDGVPEIRIAGALLDVSSNLGGGTDNSPPRPMRVRLELDRLKVTESIIINAADGAVQRRPDGTLSGRITGALGPDAPVDITLDLPARGDGKVTLTSSNAGAALRHADVYRGAVGGRLRVDATVPKGKGAGLSGQARIDNVTVRSRATFRDVLEVGGLKAAGDAVSGSGLSFRSVSVPFRYSNGIVTVTDAIAVSPVLGLKMTGTLNENTEVLDMFGVLSPAYALTGALNEIPLLGQILSGGRGEGILAMTFSLKGAMRDPRFSVNPLSLLAPGILRKLFTGRSEDAPEFKPQGAPQHR